MVLQLQALQQGQQGQVGGPMGEEQQALQQVQQVEEGGPTMEPRQVLLRMRRSLQVPLWPEQLQLLCLQMWLPAKPLQQQQHVDLLQAATAAGSRPQWLVGWVD
jgi:hypothetical protein